MPVFNADATLLRAVDSVRAQTFTDWELILVDDGSMDTSLALAEQAACADSRIRVIARSHEGIVAALREGCAVARAPLLARMDADDVMYPERLALQVKLMEENPSLGLCGTLVRMTGVALRSGRRRYETWINSLVTHADIRRERFIECPVAHPTFMVRRKAFDAIGGYRDAPWPEDYDLVFRMVQAGWKLAKVPRILLDWYESPSRLSRQDSRYSESAFRAIKRHYLFLAGWPGEKRFFQWGDGEVGKRWLREWPEAARPEAVVDINPRKIGRIIHGVPVIAPDELPAAGTLFVGIAVGDPGAREEIRQWLQVNGYEEERDYIFLA